jgi:signal transduction histidine kinase
MSTLRGQVLLGAILWTLGLLALSGTALTFHPHLFRFLTVVHGYPNTLMIGAALCMAAGLAVVGAGLAPFKEMRRRLGDVQRGAARQLLGDYPSEVRPLVKDLNALLAHHEVAVGRAIARAGDLAHGLKTPLAVLSHEADRAAAAGQHDLGGAMTEQIERMRRQIEYHLAHARAAASGATAGARGSVAASVAGLSRTLLRLHADRGIAIDAAVAADHAVRCQPEDLDEMLGNLLDNACKWGKSRVEIASAILPPKGGRDEDALIEIRVDDDGPGLDPSMREAVLQRGVRADEAAPGSGFGLAIVREIAGLYGGSIALETSPLGGLRASLRLPVAPR